MFKHFMWEDVFASKNVKTGSYLETRVPPIKSTKNLVKVASFCNSIMAIGSNNHQQEQIHCYDFFWKSLAREINYLFFAYAR